MRLIDADEIKSLYSKEDLIIRKRIFSLADRTPDVDVIPVDWLKKKYPTNAKYSGETYRQKAKFVRELIKEYKKEMEKNDKE